MKNLLMFVIAAFAAGACSAPKYSYHFDHYDYNSGKKTKTTVVSTDETASPLIIADEATLATAGTNVVTPIEKPVEVTPQNEQSLHKEQLIRRIKSMSRTERQELKKELKTELKKYVALKKSPDNINAGKDTKAWDRDLKLAAIFGAVGLVLSLFGGVNSVFWVLSVVALVIAVVFLIKWLARQ